MRLKLTKKFTTTIRQTFGDAGDDWLNKLPSLVDEAVARWGLTELQTYTLSYNFVASAKTAIGTPVVLKIGAPDPEFQTEINALTLFNGKGCAQIIDLHPNRSMFLEEQIVPGTQLKRLTNDRRRTELACDVFKQIEHDVPFDAEKQFILLTDWFAGIERKKASFGSDMTSSIPFGFQQKLHDILPTLFQTSSKIRVIHGDLHHYNILQTRDSWIAIDPKGVLGPAEYECGPFLRNPGPNLINYKDGRKIAQDRVSIMSERLGYEKRVIRDWVFCHCVLSAWWDVLPNGSGAEYSVAIADIYNDLKIQSPPK